MALSVGDRLGPYEILAPLGAGGMGEVYKARDTRLDRSVAVKVLPEHIAQRDDARARFEREARAVASLNHPNICTLHDIGPNYMVMELIEGETLAARIEKGPVPLEQAITYAIQIADALDRAHRAGVTHRDIKPQNIMITRDGVKVLDFGLAKSAPKVAPSEATLTAALTTEGAILGTPQYMAPEQFEGKEADARSDIWAFGVVLYEMAKGKKAFQGKTYASLVAAILASDPPPMDVKPFMPAWLDRLVRRCLRTDTEERYHCMHDIALDLKSPPAEATATSLMSRRWWQITAAVAIAASVLTAAVLLTYRRSGESSIAQGFNSSIRFHFTLPQDQKLRAGSHSPSVAVSSNGREIVYVIGAGGNNELFHRSLKSADSVRVAGPRGDLKAPFISPDGRWAGVFHEGKLKKVPLAGGPVETICDAPSGHGGTWNSRGLIVFSSSHISGLSSVSDRGGAVKVLTDTKSDETHLWPTFLPDGKTVLFTVASSHSITYDKARIEVLRLDTGERRVVVEKGYSAHYLDSGHLVFAYGGGLRMVPFDADQLRVTGPALQVLSGVRIDSLGPPDLDLSPSGVLVFVPGKPFVAESKLVLMDRNGAATPVADMKETFVDEPVFSPDGNHIAFTAGADERDVWTYDRRGRVMTRITHDGASQSAAWSPDGSQIAYVSSAGGASIWLTTSDGRNPAERIVSLADLPFGLGFRPDGKALMYTMYSPKTLFDVWVLPLQGNRQPVALLNSEAYEWHPAWSPDGGSIAYMSSESGREEVYIQSVDEKNKWRISTGGGAYPLWSPDGRELFFLVGQSLQVVSIRTGPQAGPFTPRKLLDIGSIPAWSLGPYAIAPDGRTFAMVRPAVAEDASNMFEVIVNWKPQ